MHESLIKYLSGLMDADGSLSFRFSPPRSGSDKHYASLMLNLVASDVVDKHGFVDSLPELTGFGKTSRNDAKNPQIKTWTVTKSSHLEMILPRLIKHQFIKGKHWQWLLDARRKQKGVTMTKAECEQLTLAARMSRIENVGPIKTKNHPAWAWLAGYLDGDGHFMYNSRNKNGYRYIHVGAVAHNNDVAVLCFLQDAFGGQIFDDSKAPVKRWRKNLGPRDASFAKQFLSKLSRHSRFKRHHIDQILHLHSQRLNVSAPTGEAIV